MKGNFSVVNAASGIARLERKSGVARAIPLPLIIMEI
jgi:hypothetical protein